VNNSAAPDWLLSEEWAVGRDVHNWILYQKQGKKKKTWKPRGYYPSPEALLKSLFRRLARTEPADPDLLQHVSRISRCVASAAARFYDQIDSRGQKAAINASLLGWQHDSF
jgi:hypothetical protein